MNNPLIHKTLFYIADFVRGDRSSKKSRILRKSQFWDRDILREWQLKKINDLLIQAKTNSPLYGKRLKNISLPLKGLEFLQDIPILTKKDIIRNIEDIKCRNISKDRFVSSNTGGSTGEPMHYFCDRLALGWKKAATLRSSEWAGLQLGEKNVQMTGSHYEYTKQQKAVGAFKLWLNNAKAMPVAYLNDEILNDYYLRLVSWRPASIWGYASGIYHFAKFIKDNYPGTDFSFIKAIITSSETLYPYQRQVINSVFGEAKVFDHYGASEFYIAAECGRHSGYHINADILYLEIADKNGLRVKEGGLGKIIITDLYNHAFPFIRYEIGDVGVLSDEDNCSCGVKLPILKKVEGRIADMVVLEDKILTPPNFTNIFRAFRGVDEYQIVQKNRTMLDINIVRNGEFNERFERHISDSLKAIMGKSAGFNLNYVGSIDVPKSGKRRYVISEVAKDSL